MRDCGIGGEGGDAQVIRACETTIGTSRNDGQRHRLPHAPPLEALEGSVGRAVVHHDDARRCGRGSRELLEAGPRVGEPIPVHDDHSETGLRHRH